MLRPVMESLICLGLAVIVFRTFEIEGYMISTGSMAPHLLGFHKRVVCPSCQWRFTCGVMYDDSVAGMGSNVTATGEHEADPLHAVCPNCGLPSIDLTAIPRNHGDQLLVAKCAYQFETPQRWDVVVFRNPYKPTQAYVKRVVGLPGEEFRIVHGDVTVAGEVQRKNLAAQQALRIPVFDTACEPSEKDYHDWQTRWEQTENTRWKPESGGFTFNDLGDESSKRASVDWLTYRHWIRLGGTHTTTVLLSEDAPDPKLPESPFTMLRFDEERRTLSCSGALPQERWDQLEALNPDERLHPAFEQLYVESHVVPVMDDYGYNRLSDGTPPLPVRDLMLAAGIRAKEGEGKAVIEMSDGRQTFAFEILFGAREVRLRVDGQEKPVRKAALPVEFSRTDGPVLVEMSLFDRQVLVACDGQLAFPPYLLDDVPPEEKPPSPPRRPVRIGARGMELAIDSLVLYRDVHYTRGKARHGVDAPYRLDDRSYFMLGDNSPVSSDSRNWDDAPVRRELLLGKPLVVHLPSRPMRVDFRGREYQVRIPDVSQIRYIR